MGLAFLIIPIVEIVKAFQRACARKQGRRDEKLINSKVSVNSIQKRRKIKKIRNDANFERRERG